MNIQAIAKWFEAGCDNTAETTHTSTTLTTAGGNKPQEANSSIAYNQNNHTMSNSSSLDQFHILQINDIGLLSKLSDIKSKTLKEKVHRRLSQIVNIETKKNFLIAVCNEFLCDGRKSLVLELLNYQFDEQTQLSVVAKQELLLQRTLCYFKMFKPKEAFTDLYQIVQQQKQASNIEHVHVHILEEIKKYLNSSKSKPRKEEIVTIDGHKSNVLTYDQILRLYEQKLSAMMKPGKGIMMTNTNNANETKTKQTFQFGTNTNRIKPMKSFGQNIDTSKADEMDTAQMDQSGEQRGDALATKVVSGLYLLAGCECSIKSQLSLIYFRA